VIAEPVAENAKSAGCDRGMIETGRLQRERERERERETQEIRKNPIIHILATGMQKVIEIRFYTY